MKKKIFIAILAVIVVAFLSGCIIFRDEIGKVRHHIYPINKKYEEKNTDNDIEKVKKAYEVVSKMQYNNFVASMITAIKDEWQPAIKAKKKNSFTGCSQREYDFDELEKQLWVNK